MGGRCVARVWTDKTKRTGKQDTLHARECEGNLLSPLTYLCIVLGIEAHHACYGAVLPSVSVIARVGPVRPRWKLAVVGVPWLGEAHGTMA